MKKLQLVFEERGAEPQGWTATYRLADAIYRLTSNVDGKNARVQRVGDDGEPVGYRAPMRIGFFETRGSAIAALRELAGDGPTTTNRPTVPEMAAVRAGT